ncbi:MAG: esterase/lipase family protein [Solirubrobacteraceae bacterium]
MCRPKPTRIAPALVVAATLALSSAAQASAQTYAPVDTPGPPLSIPVASLQKALVCTSSVAHASRAPILLVPGTTVNPSEFAWNWEPALAAQGWPYCTIDLPGNGMGDIQIAGEYVAYAIRTMYAQAGRKIDIVGHSQGGMVPRWALRFWPDTRAMVADLVGMSPSNHGTIDAQVLCAASCAPSIWQQRNNSKFIAALNSGEETFPGIAYTDIYTNTDQVVVPNFGPKASSALAGGGGEITNVAIQQVCPGDTTEHIGIGMYDNTAYAITMEALTHPGAADPALVDRSVCLHPLMPGIDPLTFATSYAGTLELLSSTLLIYPHVSAEPSLACYVTASCPGPQTPSAKPRSTRSRSAGHHRRVRRGHGRRRHGR